MWCKFKNVNMKKIVLLLVVVLMCSLNGFSSRNQKFDFADFRFKDNKTIVTKKLEDHYAKISNENTVLNVISSKNYSFSYLHHRFLLFFPIHHRLDGKVEFIFDGNRIRTIDFYPVFNNKKEKKNVRDLKRYMDHFDRKYLLRENFVQSYPSDMTWRGKYNVIDYESDIKRFRFYSNSVGK